MEHMQMPGNVIGGRGEVAGGRISGGWENLHLSEPHRSPSPQEAEDFCQLQIQY